MDVEIRQATIDDLNTLLHIIEKFYYDFGYKFEINHHKVVIQQFLNNEHLGSMWIITSEKVCIGYIALTYGFTFGYGGRDVLIDEFYILDAYRNKGLGSWVLEQIKQEVSQLGFVALNLQIEPSHAEAMDLYVRAGFQDLKRRTLTWFAE